MPFGGSTNDPSRFLALGGVPDNRSSGVDSHAMRNALAFLFGWVLAAVLLIPHARAAVTVTPMVSGYSSSAGRFVSAASGFSMTAANDGYIAPAVANVGGRAVTMPATMRMASNAGQFAKSAMRLSPLGIAGTLAAGYLAEQGLEWMQDHWQKTATFPDYGAGCPPFYANPWCNNIGLGNTKNVTCGADVYRLTVSYGAIPAGATGYNNCTMFPDQDYEYPKLYGYLNPAPASLPFPDSDWDSLPEPLPFVGPELPYAPYMPEGAPVTAPEFAPQTVAVGEPYTRADGSTAQPMARISPAGNGQVTIDTYDQPLTDPAGNPVADPQPQDTSEPTPSDCEASPNSLGCLDVGTPPAADPLPSSTVNVSFNPIDMPKNATCPAPEVLTLGGHSIPVSYDAACYYAEQMHPFVLIVATLAAAYIIFGVRRGGES